MYWSLAVLAHATTALQLHWALRRRGARTPRHPTGRGNPLPVRGPGPGTATRSRPTRKAESSPLELSRLGHRAQGAESAHAAIVMSEHAFHTWAVSSQSHLTHTPQSTPHKLLVQEAIIQLQHVQQQQGHAEPPTENVLTRLDIRWHPHSVHDSHRGGPVPCTWAWVVAI